MPPKKQIAHLKQIRRLAHPRPSARLNAKCFVFSVLVEGLNLHSVERFALWNNLHPPSHRQFYQIQNELIQILTVMARKSCEKWKSEIKDGCILSLDGSWSHRRNAQRCLVDFIDSVSRKIVDFEIVVKKNGKNGGDYVGPSNGMEREALIRMIPRWKTDTRVIGYCHDNDGKTRRTIADSGWKIDEYLDRNHIMHSFDKAYNHFQKKKLLWGLKEHLRRWMVRLICEDITLEQKKYLWEVVTIEHFSGSHEHCVPHGATAQWRFCREADRVQALKEFLMLTSKYLDKCGRLISTQMNESLHAMKAHCANKLFCWGRSWSARVCVAILQANEPVSWKFELHRLLRLPELCFESQLRLLAMAHEGQADRERRRTPEFRKRENARRKSRKKSALASEARCSDYTYHASTRPEASSEDESEEDEEELVEAAIRDVDQWPAEVPVDDCNIQDSEDDDHGDQNEPVCLVS